LEKTGDPQTEVRKRARQMRVELLSKSGRCRWSEGPGKPVFKSYENVGIHCAPSIVYPIPDSESNAYSSAIAQVRSCGPTSAL
jgi:hypothetical protein